jgi:hypothetical protein
VKLAVASFTPERFGRDVSLSEVEVKAFYEGNSERYRTEERRLISRIVLPYTPQNRDAVRKKASDALVEATRGRERFEAAAKKLAARKTGEEWLTRKEAGPELSGVLFSAPADTIVGPVDVKGTFVLAHVSRIRFPETLPLAQVRDQVVSQLRLEKGKDIATIKAFEAHPKASFRQEPREDGRGIYGVKVAETGWIGAEGRGRFRRPSPRTRSSPPPGEFGPVKTLGDAHHLFQVLAKEDSRCRRSRTCAGRSSPLPPGTGGSRRRGPPSSRRSPPRRTRRSSRPTRGRRGCPPVDRWFAPLADELPGELGSVKDARKDLALLTPKAPVSPKVYSGAGGRFVAVAFLDERPAGDADWDGKKAPFLEGMREQGRNSLVQAFVSDRMKQWKVEISPEALK